MRDPDEHYEVDVCGRCHHPGGQHVWGQGCRLCTDCPGWVESLRKRGWWSDRQTNELLAAMKAIGHPPEPPRVLVTVSLTEETAGLLSALIDPEWGPGDLEAVIGRLLDHAQQGVQRPGAWERDWLVSVFGVDWTERLERDPQVSHHDRPRRVTETEEGND